jgi:multimeric flavodoxin WrbA
MKVLNIYYTGTGNTAIIAKKIEEAANQAGHTVDTIKAGGNIEVEFLDYDFVFMGSGVYHWLPGKPLMNFIDKTCTRYRENGAMPRNAKRRDHIKAVTYCTYGGTHTGVNEAYPTTLWMGQFFDHLGVEVIGSWHIVGAFHGKWENLSVGGRLGDIRDRPNEADLKDVGEKTKAILDSCK